MSDTVPPTIFWSVAGLFPGNTKISAETKHSENIEIF